MEPPDPSFADAFSVPQEYAVLVFDLLRTAVSLSFQVHRLKVLVEAGLVAFSSACFEFADEVPKQTQHGSLAHLPKMFWTKALPRPWRILIVWFERSVHHGAERSAQAVHDVERRCHHPRQHLHEGGNSCVCMHLLIKFRTTAQPGHVILSIPRGIRDHCDCVSLLLLSVRAVFGNARRLPREGCLWKEVACLTYHGFSRTGIFSIQPKWGVGDCKSAPRVEAGRHECSPFRGTLSSTETSLPGMDSA